MKKIATAGPSAEGRRSIGSNVSRPGALWGRFLRLVDGRSLQAQAPR